MNVLMIANSLDCYGANNSMLDMIGALKSKGIHFVVLLFGNGEINQQLQRRHIKYYVVPYHVCAADANTAKDKVRRIVKDLLLAWRTKRLVKECKINLIHTNASNIDFGAMLAVMCNLPHVWHIRELLYDDYKLKYDFPYLEKKLMCRSDCLIYISHFVAKKRECGANHAVLYDGMDINKYMIHKDELFSENKIRILYCGIISKEKGTIDAIKAVQKMVEWGYQNIELDIVGALNQYCEKLMNYVKENQLEEYVTFYGHKKDMRIYRQNADVAVMCSQSEALGRVTIESMLGECLVIGADRGGTLELIKEGETGYLYEAGNAEQLAKKILSVYQDIEKSRKIIRIAKEYAMRQFDCEDYAKEIYNLYNRCISFPRSYRRKLLKK